MPTMGGFTRPLDIIHLAVKHFRGVTSRHGKRSWRIVDREWDRNEKDWRYTVRPA